MISSIKLLIMLFVMTLLIKAIKEAQQKNMALAYNNSNIKMKNPLTALIVFVCLIAALSLSGCAQCVKSHDVQYTQYVDHCVQYDSSGNCVVNMPLPHTGYETHCDEWSDR